MTTQYEVEFWIRSWNRKRLKWKLKKCNKGFPPSSVGKKNLPACNAGDLGSIAGSGRAPGEGNGTPLQCSCLDNSMDRGAWQDAVYGVAKSWTRLRLTLFITKKWLITKACFLYQWVGLYQSLCLFLTYLWEVLWCIYIIRRECISQV